MEKPGPFFNLHGRQKSANVWFIIKNQFQEVFKSETFHFNYGLYSNFGLFLLNRAADSITLRTLIQQLHYVYEKLSKLYGNIIYPYLIGLSN